MNEVIKQVLEEVGTKGRDPLDLVRVLLLAVLGGLQKMKQHWKLLEWLVKIMEVQGLLQG
jgi:hypothetical protein